MTVNPIADRITSARRDGVAAVTLPRELPSAGVEAMPWLLAGAKTLSYAVNMAALRHAGREGAGDVIFAPDFSFCACSIGGAAIVHAKPMRRIASFIVRLLHPHHHRIRRHASRR